MGLTAWWQDWIARRAERRAERERLRDAHRYGQDIARHWLAGRGSGIRTLTPGAENSVVAVAFRHALVEGTSFHDASQVAQAVLSGMAHASRSASRHSKHRRRILEASYRDAARRGVAWMAEQVLQGTDADFRLGRATIEKIHHWSFEHTFPVQRSSRLSVAGR